MHTEEIWTENPKERGNLRDLLVDGRMIIGSVPVKYGANVWIVFI
jgi:hypothetical protein